MSNEDEDFEALISDVLNSDDEPVSLAPDGQETQRPPRRKHRSSTSARESPRPSPETPNVPVAQVMRFFGVVEIVVGPLLSVFLIPGPGLPAALLVAGGFISTGVLWYGMGTAINLLAEINAAVRSR